MSTFSNFFRRAAVATVVLGTAPAAFSQAFDAVRLYGAAPGKDGGSIGLAVIAGTEYPGSDERRTLVLPLLDYQWANGWFAGVSNGLGINLSRQDKLQYGLRVTADLGRKESRSDALRGMGDIDPAAEVGVFLNYTLPAGFFLTSSLRYGSGNDHRGALLDLGAGYSLAMGSDWRLGVGVAGTVANAAYLKSYFGVSDAQAATSVYSTYRPGAGLRDVRSNVSLMYQLSRRTSITTALSASTLVGDAKDSPLARKKTSASGVVGIGYAF